MLRSGLQPSIFHLCRRHPDKVGGNLPPAAASAPISWLSCLAYHQVNMIVITSKLQRETFLLTV